MHKRSKKNNLNIFVQYSKEIGIYDEIVVINLIKSSVEEYFSKFIYFDDEFTMRFVDNNKKISISPSLATLLTKRLKKIKNEYNSQNGINAFSFLHKIVKAKVIKRVKNGFLLVDEYGNDCFFLSPFKDTNSNDDFIKEERYFYCYSISNNILRLRLDKNVASYYANLLTENKFSIVVQKWKIGKLLVFFYIGEKLGKDSIRKLKLYFQDEKFVFNNRHKRIAYAS